MSEDWPPVYVSLVVKEWCRCGKCDACEQPDMKICSLDHAIMDKLREYEVITQSIDVNDIIPAILRTIAASIIIRVQSGQHGTTKINVKSTSTSSTLYTKLQQAFKLPDAGWGLYKDRQYMEKIAKSKKNTLKYLRLSHGDMLFLNVSTSSVVADSAPSTSYNSNPVPPFVHNGVSTNIAGAPNLSVKEDDVDIVLTKMDGKIERKKNETMCRHGAGGKCLHCVPLEPFDETYLKSCEPPIKFLSFHSYIRKLRSGVDKGKFVNLENLSCKIKDCKEHAPWPAGICTKCQPNAVTLNRQAYRHIDYVTFENGNIMDRFLNYWRHSGQQRMGFLIGKYEQHPDIPLGIRAVVSAIYEPPQTCSKNCIELHDDPNEQLVDALAAELGLRRVGWVFTDLVAKDLTKGTVKHNRGTLDSYFLSAEECITAAEFQNKYLNPCQWSSDGVYGSKFVTVVVTGDKDNQIHFEGYQVSDQCMGLVRDACFIPTYDAPELGYIKESSSEQYVPDVFYKHKDKYGNEITQLARPLPVEYLLTDMSVAFPKDQIYTFTALNSHKDLFPASHRAQIGEVQELSSLANYMNQFTEGELLQPLSDFNVLLYLCNCEVLPMREHMAPLLLAVRTQDASMALEWSQSDQWSTMQHLLQASVTSPDSLGAVGRSHSFVGANASPLPPIGSTWQCAHCTFINTNPTTCNMCSLPK